MPTDFRSDRMPSPEGKGLARRAWDAYAARVNQVALPVIDPLAKSVSASMAADLMGFWLVWHLHGGFEGLRSIGMSRASLYRKIKLFRTIYKVHPDEFVLPGVTIDVETYLTTPLSQAQKSQN